MPGRGQAGQKAAHDGDTECHEQDPQIKVHVAQARQRLGRSRLEGLDRPKREESAPDRSPHQRNEKRFREQQPDDPPTGGAQGETQSDFLLTVDRARQGQVRDVGAGNDQKEGYRRSDDGKSLRGLSRVNQKEMTANRPGFRCPLRDTAGRNDGPVPGLPCGPDVH